MPAKPKFFRNLGRLIRTVEGSKQPTYVRAEVAALLGCGGRQAQRRMGQMGAQQFGQTFVVNTDQLLDWLRTVQESGDYEYEANRVAKLEGRLDVARQDLVARRREIKTAPLPESGLPEGIALEPGVLRIEFDGFDQMATRLYQLAQWLARNTEEAELRATPEKAEAV